MLKTFISCFSLLLFSDCADNWTRSGTTEQHADADLYLCQRENKNISDGSVVGPNGDLAQEEMVRQCMRARGYKTQ